MRISSNVLGLWTAQRKYHCLGALRSSHAHGQSEAHLYENQPENTSSGQQLLELVHTISGPLKQSWPPHFYHTKLNYLCAHFTSISDAFLHPLPSLSAQNGAPVYTGVQFSKTLVLRLSLARMTAIENDARTWGLVKRLWPPYFYHTNWAVKSTRRAFKTHPKRTRNASMQHAIDTK